MVSWAWTLTTWSALLIIRPTPIDAQNAAYQNAHPGVSELTEQMINELRLIVCHAGSRGHLSDVHRIDRTLTTFVSAQQSIPTVAKTEALFKGQQPIT